MTIIDVRTYHEFMGGHVVDSKNIPLIDLHKWVEEIKLFQAPIVCCCSNGNRSQQAADFLIKNGIDASNGGSWLQVNNLVVNQQESL
ncbi:MAG: rhodanese-like domain-containing protein [Lewinellaceae bacterium]|nr:rhodanese-like domain-containing protein [Lewinellaceae bacterium]